MHIRLRARGAVGRPSSLWGTLIVSALCFLCLPVAVSPAATTIRVDGSDTSPDSDGCGGGADLAADPCDTIQAGVAAAVAGDTVSVEAGSYTENVLIDKQLTIEGAQAGTDARGRVGAAESIVIGGADQLASARPFNVTAAGTVIDGFTVRPAGFNAGIALHEGATAAAVHNTIFDNATNPDTRGVFLGGADQSDVWHNRFDGPGAGVIGGGATPIDAAAIEENLFEGGGGSAVRLGSEVPVSQLLIAGNSADSGILIGGANGVAIIGNAIVGAFESAIELKGTNDALIAANVLGQNGGQGIWFTSPTNTSALVLGNDISDNFGGVTIDYAGDSYAGVLEMHLNRIVGNLYGGARNDNPYGGRAIGAEDNWWGCNEGPDAPGCDATSGFVYTDPFLVLRLSPSPRSVARSGAATLTADLTVDSDGVRLGADLTPLIPPLAVAFGTDAGSVSPVTAMLEQGMATSIFAAPNEDRVANATVTLDAETVSAPIQVRTAPIPSGALQAPDRVRPVFEQASLDRRVFAVDMNGAAEKVLRTRVKPGTTFRYRLSESAGVTFAIERRAPGRKVGRSCRRPTTKNRRNRRCTRYVLVGRFAAHAKAGENAKRFSGRIGRKSLRPGRYRATLVATDSAGNRSQPTQLAFRVVSRTVERRIAADYDWASGLSATTRRSHGDAPSHRRIGPR